MVQQRLLNHARVAEQERDQQAANTPVAIEEWVDRLTLHVGKSGARGSIAPRRECDTLRTRAHDAT